MSANHSCSSPTAYGHLNILFIEKSSSTRGQNCNRYHPRNRLPQGSSGFSSSWSGPTLWFAKESITNTPTNCLGDRPPDVACGTPGGTLPQCQLDTNWTNRRRPKTPALHISTATAKESHQMDIYVILLKK